MLDGDTVAKESSLNLSHSIESFFYDNSLNQIVVYWQDDHGYWLEYENASMCMRDFGMMALKYEELEFIALVD